MLPNKSLLSSPIIREEGGVPQKVDYLGDFGGNDGDFEVTDPLFLVTVG